MSAPAIKVEGLSKRYKLGLTHAGSIREAVNRGVRRLTRRGHAHGTSAATQEAHDPDRVEDGYFWALKDVSFEVQPGEVVGIIGKNGAGKSTLLKILSRITKPTSGRCTLRGRVASLLEVGTGFHPELTGRENVYMNGTILGMTKREIDRRFDEIVAFAEVEKFIDTPVKRYSSGMTVRLGFAVAAHLDPEILIVDEVLAVGDVDFQRRCLTKLESVASSGRTVLFVSHNMSAVRALCSRVVLIANGTVECDGSTAGAIEDYLRRDLSAIGGRYARPADPSRHEPIQYTYLDVHLVDHTYPRALKIKSELVSYRPHRPAFIAMDISDETQVTIMQAVPVPHAFLPSDDAVHLLEYVIDLPPLTPGRYYCTAWVGPSWFETYENLDHCACFDVIASPTPKRTVPHHPIHGRIVPHCRDLRHERRQ